MKRKSIKTRRIYCSAYPTGTSFELYFPITRDEVVADEELSSWENYAGNRETILVVDDEKLQREIACGLLIKLGYSATLITLAIAAKEELIK